MFKVSLLLLLSILFSCQEQIEFAHPSVYTGEVVNITDTSALLSGKIDNYSDLSIIESGFIWGLYSNDYEGIKTLNNEIPNGEFHLETNYPLLPNRKYYVRAFASTQDITIYGTEQNFTSGKGQEKRGNWSSFIYENLGYGNCRYINSSFSLDLETYILFDDGSLVNFDHTSKEFSLILENDIIKHAYFSTVKNNEVFIFSNDRFYQYLTKDNTLIPLSKIPDNYNSFLYSPSGFLIDDHIFIGLGETGSVYRKQFWSYDITSDSWDQIADFPGEYRLNGYSFSINGYGYVGGGFNLIGSGSYPKFNDLWQYSPEQDKWIKRQNLPISNEGIFDLEGITNKNLGYCFYKGKFYEYNSIFNTWLEMTSLNQFTNENWCSPHLFSTNDEVYLLSASEYNDEKYFKIWNFDK